MDRYHGSACPRTGREDALFRDLNRHAEQRVAARAARKQLRDSLRQWIVGAGTSPPTTPMWTSRRGWLEELTAWTQTSAGGAALAGRNLRPVLLLSVAEALANHADHANGRHCAATNATIAAAASCSPRTVTTVRTVLREAGLAVEIRRGTGSTVTPHLHRRPSVWHLVSLPRPVDNVHVCDLPPSLRDRRFSYVGKTSPSGRTRPPRRNLSTTDRRRPPTPRPLKLQQMAAAIIAGSVGLNTVHPGHLCDALARSGLDLTAWTAAQILQALNADMRKTGWSWPNHIERPGAFLASRLRRLPQTPQVNPPRRPCAPTAPVPPTPPASAAARAAAIAYFRAHRTADSTRCTTAAVGEERHRASPERSHCEPSAAKALRRLVRVAEHSMHTVRSRPSEASTTPRLHNPADGQTPQGALRRSDHPPTDPRRTAQDPGRYQSTVLGTRPAQHDPR
jgi:hypothetical protein